MKGQRTVLIRGTLAWLLCAVLLSTFFTATVFGGKSDPLADRDIAVPAAVDPGDTALSDGGGSTDPPPDGDPDDYDKIIVDFWVMLLEFPLIMTF